MKLNKSLLEEISEDIAELRDSDFHVCNHDKMQKMEDEGMEEITVYFETDKNKYAEKVATFYSEDTYIKCLPQLRELAKTGGFVKVTESIKGK